MIPIYKPYIPEKSVEYAKAAIDSGWISSIGEYVERAEELLKSVTKSKYCILVNNGTSATHLTVRALQRFYPETKRVHVPSSCYVAAYNSLCYDNYGWDICASDLTLDSWNMTIPRIESGDAIMAVHNLGNKMDLSHVNCPIIEDSCETLFADNISGLKSKNSLCCSLSFFGNKNITSGEGGAVLTDDEDVYNLLSKLKGQGQTSKRYIHDELGYNYRMTNIQAALLLGQLEEYEEILVSKRIVFSKYNQAFSGVDNIIPQKIQVSHSCWMYGIRIVGSSSYEENQEYFAAHNIETRPMFYPYSEHGHLNISGPTKNAEILSKEIVMLPSYPELTQNNIDYITFKTKELANLK